VKSAVAATIASRPYPAVPTRIQVYELWDDGASLAGTSNTRTTGRWSNCFRPPTSKRA
jgi:hypothetical protein